MSGAWSWAEAEGVALDGDYYAAPGASDRQSWRAALRGERIPWGKTHTAQGDALMAAIKNLDVDGVTSALGAFEARLAGAAPLRVATTLLYGRGVRR
mmetsp:Transcript_43936/g.138082  ORF Transcript_43936/g.138082 Transcript_43936/m.138082 type:complete len:97 (+) Transcript_43936:98-388(+)